MSETVVLITSSFFIFPYFSQLSNMYNSIFFSFVHPHRHLNDFNISILIRAAFLPLFLFNRPDIFDSWFVGYRVYTRGWVRAVCWCRSRGFFWSRGKEGIESEQGSLYFL